MNHRKYKNQSKSKIPKGNRIIRRSASSRPLKPRFKKRQEASIRKWLKIEDKQFNGYHGLWMLYGIGWTKENGFPEEQTNGILEMYEETRGMRMRANTAVLG